MTYGKFEVLRCNRMQCTEVPPLAMKFQTWSITGYLVAKMLLEDPSHLGMIALEEDKAMLKPVLKRSASWTN